MPTRIVAEIKMIDGNVVRFDRAKLVGCDNQYQT